MSSLNIFSYNVNGFNDDDKRDEIIRHLYTLRADIQILIDTRLKDKDENRIRNHADIFNYSCVFQNRKDQNSSRGILVLISKNKDIDFETLYKSDDGNFILLKIKYDNRKILIAATYGPNKDNPNFYLRNLRKIENCNLEETILCGDFNIVNHHNIDQIGYNNERNKRAKTILNGYIDTKQLFDPVDHFELERPHCTWFKPDGTRQSKLDSFFITQNLRGYLKNYTKHPIFNTDHTPISITLDFSKFKAGKGNWKLPKILLHDESFIYGCKYEIKKVVSQYTKNPETDTEYFLSEDTIFYKFLNELDLPKAWDLEFTINIKTLLDMIIMAIKDYSISYQRKMLTDDTKKLKQLLDEYTEANVKLNLNPANQYLKIENDNRLEKYQDELKAQRQKSLYRTKFIEKLHGERTN